jgi:hypothetical protein
LVSATKNQTMMSSKDKDKADNIENMFKDSINSILIGKKIFLLIKNKNTHNFKDFLIIKTLVMYGITQYIFAIFICRLGIKDNISFLKINLIN